MKERLTMLLPPMPRERVKIRQGEGDRVVLLHGLWRSVWAMEGMAGFLNEKGYETVNVPYASFRKSLEELVQDVAGVLRGCANDKRIHFVTHSMGGILLRLLLERFPEFSGGRIVMLAPPNQGSEIVDWMAKLPFAPSIFGPGGMALATQQVRGRVPGFSSGEEVAVLMGRKRAVPFFSSLFNGDHDGIVTVKSGEVQGMSELEVFDADHTFIMAEDAVKKKVAHFLAHGPPNR